MNIIFILLQSCDSQPLTSFFCLRFLASHQKFDVKRSEEEEVKIKVNKFVFRSNKLAQWMAHKRWEETNAQHGPHAMSMWLCLYGCYVSVVFVYQRLACSQTYARFHFVGILEPHTILYMNIHRAERQLVQHKHIQMPHNIRHLWIHWSGKRKKKKSTHCSLNATKRMAENVY